jgi:hypothetical protein
VEIVATGRLIVETPVENDEVNSSVSLDNIDSSVSFEDENGSLHMVEPICSLEEETGSLLILYKASDSTFVHSTDPEKGYERTKRRRIFLLPCRLRRLILV